MTLRTALLSLALLGAAAAVAAVLLRSEEHAAAPEATRPAPRAPAPIDAAQIATGKLSMERLPPELGAALEAHSEQIVRTAEALERKQERITGSCAPGSAIRVIAEDGSVSCQRLPKGVSSVSALAGVPLLPTTQTSAASVPGGIGRFQTAGEDDYLIVPISIPDGAIVTSFTYVYYDASDKVDGAAYLYRSDDQPLAAVQTAGAVQQVRTGTTDQVQLRKVDAQTYAYFVYFQVSTEAGASLLPISASVAYRLP